MAREENRDKENKEDEDGEEKILRRNGINKAGYTANTSRGRVGRGGIARFCTFSTR